MKGLRLNVSELQISTIRRKDHEAVEGHTEYEDLLQRNNLPNSDSPPGTFLFLKGNNSC